MNSRQRQTKNVDDQNDHRYQPFYEMAKPPKHPDTRISKKSINGELRFLDSRDDVEDGYASGSSSGGSSVNSLSGRPYRNNDPITVVTVTLKQCLKAQKKILGLEHPSVTKTMHSLALEYKVQGKLNKAVNLLRRAIEILDSRLSKVRSDLENNCNIDNASYSDFEITADNEQCDTLNMLEEKAMLYSCLGNIFRLRTLYNEAIDNYLKSCEMLVEAGYSGESKRVSMIVRIMRRTESERITKPPRKKW